MLLTYITFFFLPNRDILIVNKAFESKSNGKKKRTGYKLRCLNFQNNFSRSFSNIIFLKPPVLTPDGKSFIVEDPQNKLYLFEIKSGKKIHEFEGNFTFGFYDRINSLIGNNKLITRNDNRFIVWNLNTGLKELEFIFKFSNRNNQEDNFDISNSRLREPIIKLSKKKEILLVSIYDEVSNISFINIWDLIDNKKIGAYTEEGKVTEIFLFF